MTRLSMVADTLVATTAGGRTVTIQRITELDRYEALIGQGVRASVAVALMKGLITLKEFRG